MSVQMTNSGTPQGHANRAPRAEFYAYFGMIFVGALSYAVVAWTARTIVTRKLPPNLCQLRRVCESWIPGIHKLLLK